MAIRKHLLHAKSAVPGKLPTAENIEYGEIAVNYAEGTETLSIRNSNDDIVTFMNANSVYTKEETDAAIAAAASVGDVEASGTSPLNLSSETQDGKIVITGSVDDATASTSGVVKPVSVLSESVEINDASATKGRYYPVQTNPDNQMVVNVPWIDYSEGTSDGSGLMTAEEKEALQKIYDYLKEQAVTYGDITATLTYPNISASGGTSSPTLTYSQTATHFDGTTETVTSGASVTYSGNYVNSSSGMVTYSDINTSDSETVVDTVTATIILNGKSTTVTATVYQEANYVVSYGDITATLTYPNIDASGGTASPTLSYSQTISYANGTSETVTSGASVTYSGSYVNSSTGVVTYNYANSSTSQQAVDTVTATIILSGKSATVSATVYQTENIALMNVAFYDNTEDKIITVEGYNINTDDYPASRYTPIGIVIVSSSWDVYGDGTCGVISLSEMNYETPDTGSNTDYQYIYWGHSHEDTELTNYNSCVVTGYTSSPSENATGNSEWSFLPSDTFSVTACPTDSSAYYYNSASGDYAAPSPYLDDGSLNPVYVQTESPSSEYNCLSDFDGKGNTEVLLELATSQPDWKTADNITNYYENGYSPAACCCWRYSTEGTKQGDWYLPAMGELGCVMARLSAINNTISKLNSVYGTVGLSLYNNYGYCSSSEHSSDGYRTIETDNGFVGHNNTVSYVRAFARL